MAAKEGAAEEPAAVAPDGKILVVIRFGAGVEEMAIKLKMTTPFSKVYDVSWRNHAVAKARGIAADSFILEREGVRLGKEDTPKMHEFDQEEQIDFHMHQVGGVKGI